MMSPLAPGKYVIAVSGGVDSMVLLDFLYHKSKLWEVRPPKLVVAHFDHGIRDDSGEDRRCVQAAAKRYGVPFEYAEGKLGATASEATAREARYAFLERVRREYGAMAIVTAHHEDDLLETAVLNILRGTGRKGLSSLTSREDIIRPLLHVPKEKILAYAQVHHVSWREDGTNAEDKYLRNYIRHHIMPKLEGEGRERLRGLIAHTHTLNETIDRLLEQGLQEQQGVLHRYNFVMLPHDVACETMAAFLRGQGVRSFDRKLIGQLVVFAKTAQPGKRADVDARHYLQAGRKDIRLSERLLS